MKALTEYTHLHNISEKLNFDASGRPGAIEIRKDQDRIRLRKHRVSLATQKNLRVPSPSHNTPHSQLADWSGHHHAHRQQAVDTFIATLNLHKLDIDDGSPRRLFSIPIHNPIGHDINRLGLGWFYKKTESVSWDNSFYSKSWHRQYGGKKEVSNRMVIFKRISPRSKKEQVITVHMDSWRGDWLAKAVIAANLDPGSKKTSLKIRLNRAYGAKLISSRHGYKTYRRTLVGKPVDYVIQSPAGVVYHTDDRSALLSGLHNKIRAAGKTMSGKVDWKLCKKLGFCSAGISTFCSEYGLDKNSSYSPEYIHNLIMDNPSAASPFAPELRTLATALDYTI